MLLLVRVSLVSSKREFVTSVPGFGLPVEAALTERLVGAIGEMPFVVFLLGQRGRFLGMLDPFWSCPTDNFESSDCFIEVIWAVPSLLTSSFDAHEEQSVVPDIDGVWESILERKLLLVLDVLRGGTCANVPLDDSASQASVPIGRSGATSEVSELLNERRARPAIWDGFEDVVGFTSIVLVSFEFSCCSIVPTLST